VNTANTFNFQEVNPKGQSYDLANRTRKFILEGKRDRYAHGSEFKSQWSVNINVSSNER